MVVPADVPASAEKAYDLPIQGNHHGKSSWVVAAGHIAVILLGPGILAMPYIMSTLGWVGALLGLVVCCLLTRWTSGMMADVYEVDGRRHGRYDVAVRSILGGKHAAVLAASQHVNLVLSNVGFQTATADSISHLALASCQARGIAEAMCWNSQPIITVIVGVLQLLLSQMRNLQAARWCSAAGSVASLVYCGICLALAASQAGNLRGSINGIDAPMSEKIFRAFNALGAVAFGLNAPIITFEVQDTLKEPPAAAVSMKKSLTLSLGACITIFAAGGVLGYLALGDDVGANFLLAFQDTAPASIIIIGSICVAMNMVSAYQVCGQPTFAAVEDSLSGKLQKCACCKGGKSWLLSLLFRSFYVACTTVLAVALPFFAIILGLVGSSTFFQTGVLYPILLHRAVKGQKRTKYCLTSVVLVVAAAVTAMAVVGSVAVIVMSAAQLSPLKAL